jgi:hypothetical protein
MMMMMANHAMACWHTLVTARGALAASATRFAASFLLAATPRAKAPVMTPQAFEAAAAAASAECQHACHDEQQLFHDDFLLRALRATAVVDTSIPSIGGKTGRVQQIATTVAARPDQKTPLAGAKPPFTQFAIAR